MSELVLIPKTAINENVVTPSGRGRQGLIPQWAIPYAEGSAEVGKKTIVLLDAMRLLFSDKMQHYEQ